MSATIPGAHATIHGTAVALGDAAALIRGRSGSGKSDLALRCIGLGANSLIPGPAVLVADDRVIVTTLHGSLQVTCPASISGLLEVRGLGILRVRSQLSARLALVVDLVAASEMERLPQPGLSDDIAGISVPLLRLCPFEASAPLKLLLALARGVS